MSWFVRELLKVLLAPAIAIGALAIAIVEATGEGSGRGTAALLLGLAGGLIPMSVEIVLAVRSGTMFIRDPAVIAARQASRAALARRVAAPGAALGVAFVAFPGLVQVVLLALAGGYLLPYSVILAGHFLRNHREIKELTRT